MYPDSFLLYEKTVWTRTGINVVHSWTRALASPPIGALMQIAFVFLISIRSRGPTSYFVFVSGILAACRSVVLIAMVQLLPRIY